MARKQADIRAELFEKVNNGQVAHFGGRSATTEAEVDMIIAAAENSQPPAMGGEKKVGDMTMEEFMSGMKSFFVDNGGGKKQPETRSAVSAVTGDTTESEPEVPENPTQPGEPLQAANPDKEAEKDAVATSLLTGKSLKTLREMAEGYGVAEADKLDKHELIAAIEKAQLPPDAGAGTTPDPVK